MPGPIFGKYEVLKRLAIGGMGEVFLARQTGVPGFERHAILKSLLPDLAEQSGAIDEFLDEARVAATLNHPNLVSIYEVGLWEGIYYIAMEYIDGDDLAGLRKAALACGQYIPFEVAARIVRDAAEGLDHAHRAHDMTGKAMEIVHRDISPQNIMVRRDGVTKVVDFGIARAANRSTRTKTGMTKGKLAYMPPEQVRGQRVDGRSDQYALGVVLWELLTGKRLFVGESDVDLIKQVLRGKIPKPSEIDATVPAELESIALHMMQREAGDRFASCRDVATSLKAWLDKVAPGMGTAEVSQFVVAAFDGGRAKSEKSARSNENFVIDLQAPAGGTPSNPFGTRPQNSERLVAAADLPPLVLAGPGDFSAIKPRLAASLEDEAVAAPVGPTPGPQAIAVPSASALKSSPVLVLPEGPSGGIRMSWVGIAIGLAGLAAVVALSFGRKESSLPEAELKPAVALAPPTGRVTPRAPTVAAPTPTPVAEPLPAKLHLESVPPGAEVVLAGKVLGTTPFDTDQLPPETAQELEVRLPGYRAEHATVRVSRGMISNEVVTLHALATRTHGASTKVATGAAKPAAAPAVAAPAFGYLSVDTKPWTQVEIDGSGVGPTPVLNKKLATGTHQVVMINEAANIKSTRSVTIKPDDTTKLILQLP